LSLVTAKDFETTATSDFLSSFSISIFLGYIISTTFQKFTFEFFFFEISEFAITFLKLLLLCWVGIPLSIYKSSYNVSNVSYLQSPPLLLSFIPSPLIPGTVSTGIIFAFTYM
jgi:hypothetical protein